MPSLMTTASSTDIGGSGSRPAARQPGRLPTPLVFAQCDMGVPDIGTVGAAVVSIASSRTFGGRLDCCARN